MRASDGTYYEIHGRDDAPVVVLIHGLGLCQEIWAPYIKGMAQNFRVVTYDLYGHGKSTPAGETASLTVYSNQIADLMDELDITKAAIVGFSIGGMINRRFALDHHDRLSCLVILNSPHDRGSQLQEKVEASANLARDHGTLATMDAALARWFTPQFRETHANTVAKVIEWRQLADSESYAQAAWVLAAGVRELTTARLAVDVPSLVMTCENDIGSTPAMAHAIADQIFGAELKIIPDLKHLGLMEDKDAFANPIMEFLDKHLS